MKWLAAEGPVTGFVVGLLLGSAIATGIFLRSSQAPPPPNYAKAAACEGALAISLATGADPNEVFKFHTGLDAAGICYPKETK